MPPTAALLAIGFGNLAMLGWLGAAAAPILIHLLSRRKYRRTSWAAMEYLLAAIRQSSRRLRLEQWLLLAVRTLLVVLVVSAVAEPFFERSPLSLLTGQRTHRVLVMDVSYSMGYKPTDKTRFDQAKEIASRIVEESPQGDGFTLVLMAAPPRVVVGTPALHPGDFLREIEGLHPLGTSADLPATLSRVEEVLLAARREQPRLTAERVYFLTDLGRAGWMPEFRDAAAMTAFRQRTERLAQSAGLVVIDVGQTGAENLAVTGLRVEEPFATIGRAVTVEAELKLFGRQPRLRQPVELWADGRLVKKESVDVTPGGQATATFHHSFESPGDHTLEVRADGDALDVDNHRYAVLDVKPFLRVLCIDGRPSGGTFQGAADYLAFALEPRPAATGRAPVHAEVAPESALLERDLRAYDCVFACDVAQFTSGEAQVLDAYLKSGGGLVFFLGPRVQADRYNRELGGEGPSGVRLLPARLGSVVSQSPAGLDSLGYRHEIVEAFRNRERTGLLTAPVYSYVRLTLGERSKAKIALASATGDPMIVEEPIHKGRVVLVATSADATWTAMPLLPSYLPLVQEILSFAVAGQGQQRNLEVGQPLGATLAASAAGAAITLRGPDGRGRELRPRTEGDQTFWTFSDTLASGLYTAEYSAPAAGRESYAVNVDTRLESDLTKLSPEELREEVWSGIPFVHQTTWENVDQQPAARLTQASPMPVGLLYAALVLLFVETVIAWRFGHHQR